MAFFRAAVQRRIIFGSFQLHLQSRSRKGTARKALQITIGSREFGTSAQDAASVYRLPNYGYPPFGLLHGCTGVALADLVAMHLPDGMHVRALTELLTQGSTNCWLIRECSEYAHSVWQAPSSIPSLRTNGSHVQLSGFNCTRRVSSPAPAHSKHSDPEAMPQATKTVIVVRRSMAWMFRFGGCLEPQLGQPEVG